MDSARIEDLKRRIQRDPASIAFAQLGEEYRRAGRYREAIETCRAGLRHHPGYLSARVTLGRSLVEIGDLEHARHELEGVLGLAPENLAALRGLADIAHRRGDDTLSLAYLRQAAAVAPQDAELQQMIAAAQTRQPDQQRATAQAADPNASTARTLRIIAALERWHRAIVARRGARRS